ncbi:hypothetical protein [uncultured Sphingomonas sp.]|uniref:hypothetical protein n=1 Tax=uncultured Sphingomonas sp. TaxID=158754 RepID=UPI0025D9FD87|nr:hypothetical protein [uncultured Sphingomonas sp.]
MEARSRTGSIRLAGDAVVITRRELFGSSDNSRTIRLSELVGVDFRAATAFQPGYLKLVFGGGDASSDLSLKAFDRNALEFAIEDQPQFSAIRGALMERITGEPFVEPAPAQGEKAKLIVIQLVFAAIGFWLLWTIVTS